MAAGKKKLAPKKLQQGKRGNAPFTGMAKRAKTTAREARDVVTAVGTLKNVATNKNQTGAKGGTAKQLKKAVGNLGTQIKETGRAAITGKSGTRSKRYMTSTGDTASDVVSVKKKTGTTALRKAEVKAIKSGARAAKDPMTMSKAARNSGQLAREFNQGYISGKRDIAASKRAKKK